MFKAVAQNDWKTLLALLNEEHFSEVDRESRGGETHLDTFVRNENGFTLLHQAACGNRPEMVDFLWHLSDSWEGLVDLTIDPPWSPKWPVTMLGQKPMENGLVGDIVGKNALQLAAILGHHKVVAALRAKMELQSSLSDIHCAVKLRDIQWLSNIIGDTKCVKTLVNDCVDSVVSPLWLACTKGDVDIVKRLIDAGADVNLISKNDQQQTLLHRAVCFGNKAVVRYLIQGNYLGVDVKDRYGCTPLYYALQLHLPCMSTLLLSHGADLDLQCVNPLSLGTDSARLLLECLELQHLRQLLLHCPQLQAEEEDLPAEVGECVSFVSLAPRVMPWPFSLTPCASWMQGLPRRSQPVFHYYFSLPYL